MTVKSNHKSNRVIPSPSLLYRRVKFLCTNTSTAGERNIELQLSHGAAVRLKKKITKLNLTIDEVLKLTPSELVEKYFFDTRINSKKFKILGIRGNIRYLVPDFAVMTRELMRSRAHSGGSTNRKLELQRRIIYEDIYCSEENTQKCKIECLTLYSLSNFNRLWRLYEHSNIVPSFRRKEEPGAISEFDFTGVTMTCKDGTKVQFAVLVLAYSRLIYVEAIPSQNAADSANAILNGFRFFGGVTETLRIDNFKAAVTYSGRYGGEFTATYRMLSDFLGFTLSSMPVRSGWLKGHAEAAVKIITHTLIARMKKRERDGEPFSNINHIVRGLNSTRRIIFEEDEKDKLLPVSNWDFRASSIETRTVPPTARFEVKGHEYCLPANLIGNKVQLELKPQLVIFYEDGRPICTYKRLDNVTGTSTCKGYNPPQQLFIEVLKAIPLSLFYEWAQAIGPETLKKVKWLLRGTINIDKLRRALKLLSLPHEIPDCYKYFESFLKKQPSNMGVSKLQSLWRVWPEKSNSARLDPVYQFNYLFEKVEARLYGEEVNLCWDTTSTSPLNSEEHGMVFLNYHKDDEPASNIASNCEDPKNSNNGDPDRSTCGDPSHIKDIALINSTEKEKE